MSGAIAGLFDPAGRADPEGAAAALGADSWRFDEGPLHLACAGGGAVSPRAACALDGWIDDAAELAAGLGSGAPAGAGPEELLAAGLRRWGDELPARLRGDFAFLAWDREAGRGLLVRDQLGARPFFLHRRDGVLRFASEVRLLLAMLPTRPSPDPAAVAAWVAAEDAPADSTLFAGISRLGAGTALALGPGGVGERRYWRPRFQPLEIDSEELTARTRAALERAVARRDEGELTAVLMSGGLDSASVAALCAAVPGRPPVTACSATFPDHPAVDEAELIAELGRELGLRSIEQPVHAGGMLATAVEHRAEWQLPPASWGDGWALPLLRAAAAAGIGSVLDGEGGDEVFAPRAQLFADELRHGHPLRARAVLRSIPGYGLGVGRRDVARVAANLARGALPHGLEAAARRPVRGRAVPAWLRPRLRRELAAGLDPGAWKRLDGPRWWARVAHQLTVEVEAGGMFEARRRRAAMAGLETRHPLLDLDLVELSLAAPPRASLDPRLNRPLLREATAGLLPDSVRLRPGKARFDSYLVDTLAGADGEALRRLLGDPAAELGAYVDLGAMRAELLGGEAERHDPFAWMYRAWRLASAEIWLRGEAGKVVGNLPAAPSFSRYGAV